MKLELLSKKKNSEIKVATLMFRNYYYYLSFSNLETIARKYPENVLIGANIIGFLQIPLEFSLCSNQLT